MGRTRKALDNLVKLLKGRFYVREKIKFSCFGLKYIWKNNHVMWNMLGEVFSLEVFEDKLTWHGCQTKNKKLRHAIWETRKALRFMLNDTAWESAWYMYDSSFYNVFKHHIPKHEIVDLVLTHTRIEGVSDETWNKMLEWLEATDKTDILMHNYESFKRAYKQDFLNKLSNLMDIG